MTFRRNMFASLMVAAFAGAPLAASASSLCNSSTFSSIESPLSFASSIESAFTPSTTNNATEAGTTASTSTETCIAYISDGYSTVCEEYSVTSTGSTTNVSNGTSQTVTEGEQALADAQKLVMQYQGLQAKLCSLASLNGMAFSAWPDQAQSVVNTVNELVNGTDGNASDAATIQSTLQSQEANNAAQLAYIKDTLAPNVTGETSATQVNSALLELMLSQQQQQMQADAAGGVQFTGASLPMAPAMMGSMFDTNEPADAGWYF